MTPESTRGTVSVTRVAKGSKSEHVNVVLTTPERSFLLRHIGTGAFALDPSLVTLDGKTVRVTGYPGTSVFLLTEDPLLEEE
jgi:hypothetical protein